MAVGLIPSAAPPRFHPTAREDVAVSVITEAELRTGAANKHDSDDDPSSDREFSSASHAPRKAGTPIGPMDMLIAAQAVARNLILVSNNEREFGRITTLTLENWARDSEYGGSILRRSLSSS